MIKLIVATAFAAGLLSGAAQASTVVQVKNFFNTADTNLNFNAFDPTLGIFTSAILDVSGTANIAAGSITGTTEDILQGPANGLFEVFVDGELSTVGAGLLSNSIVSFLRNCFASVGSECTASYSAGSEFFTLGAGSTSAADFDSPFSVGLSLVTSASANVGSPTGAPTTSWLASGTATLVYSYEPDAVAVIPLPASLPLALGGVLALGAVARRRKS